MFCPSCGVAVEPAQRFCNACGTALLAPQVSPGASFPPPTEQQAVTSDDIAVPPGQIPPIDSPEFDEMFDTKRFAVVEQTTPTQEQIGTSWESGAADTAVWPADTTATADITDAVPRITAEAVIVYETSTATSTPLRVAILLLALATATVTVLAAVLTAVSYRVTGDVQADVEVRLNDLTSNALVAAVIAAAFLLIGGALAMNGARFGIGLAGGAGLAVAGTMAWLAGEAVSIIDTLKRGFAESALTYRLSTTMDVGLWLAIAAAALGGLVFLIALLGVRGDRSPALHPVVGAVGMLGTLAMAFGPLLPTEGARFADNFSSDRAVGPSLMWKNLLNVTLGITHDAVPPVTTWMRVLVLLLLLVGGFVGFIAGSRWGLGMVLGAIGIAVWQWVTATAEAGDIPFGIAGGNRYTIGFEQHIVTTIGVIATALALLAGTALAYLPRKDAAATS